MINSSCLLKLAFPQRIMGNCKSGKFSSSFSKISYFNGRNVSEPILKVLVDLHHNLTDFDKFHIFSLCYTNVHHDCATHRNDWM